MRNIFWARSEEIDFNFFLDIVYKDKYPEYNEYCYRLNNVQRLSIRCKTKITYVPLLDMVPVNSTTMQTFMIQAENCFLEGFKGFASIYVTSKYITLLPVSYGITLG